MYSAMSLNVFPKIVAYLLFNEHLHAMHKRYVQKALLTSLLGAVVCNVVSSDISV